MPGRTGLVAGVALAVALALAPQAGAAAFEVTRQNDPAPGECLPSDCSLREAVLAANARMGPDRIVLPDRGVHQLSIPAAGGLPAQDGDLDVTTDPLRIVHPERGRATIDFNPPGDGFPDPLDRVFENFAGAPLTLERISVAEGGDPADLPDGGGIFAGEDVTLIDSAVVRSEAPGSGGGVFAVEGAAVTLRKSAVRGNTATLYGGGIYHGNGSSSDLGPLNLVRSAVAGNESGSEGGGIYFTPSVASPSLIRRSAVTGNVAHDEGGGILADNGQLTVSASTVSGNRSTSNGGGMSIDSLGSVAVVNSTIAGNRADGVGGGINGESDMSLNAVTVARNRGNADGVLSEAGGGIYVEAGDTFTVENSLIALNTLTALTPGDPPVRNDCAGGGPFASAGHNLLSTRFLCDGFDQAGDRARSNPRIGTLRDNGGPTKTIALKRRSAALNRADPQTAPPRDQRGRTRHNPDIGAFERTR